METRPLVSAGQVDRKKVKSSSEVRGLAADNSSVDTRNKNPWQVARFTALPTTDSQTVCLSCEASFSSIRGKIVKWQIHSAVGRWIWRAVAQFWWMGNKWRRLLAAKSVYVCGRMGGCHVIRKCCVHCQSVKAPSVCACMSWSSPPTVWEEFSIRKTSSISFHLLPAETSPELTGASDRLWSGVAAK